MQKNTPLIRGGILINKPAGITSHDAVYAVRRYLNNKDIKVGHSGTLDPFATGLLIILLGGATRLQDELHLLPKTYRAEITLGAISDTDDVTGMLEERPVASIPSEKAVRDALQYIKQQETQIPPAYSAIKIQGKKMYDIARAGKSVELRPRNITIYKINLENYTYPKLTITATCSTGTYIRSIARDVGTILNTGGYCSQLERTAIGNFGIQRAIQLTDLPENINSVLIPLEELTEHLSSISFSDSNVAKLKNGREVEIPKKSLTAQPIALKNIQQKVFGIGIREAGSACIKPTKIFP